MEKHNAGNERIKRDYFRLLKEARGYDETSIDAVAQSINRFETYTRHKAFERFHIEQAIGFKRWFAEQKNPRTGRLLAKATQASTMRALREFFLWLSGQPGFRSRISFGDTAYFRISEKDVRAAQTNNDAPVPSIEQIVAVLNGMPTLTILDRRNRAVIAFILLTGARDNAAASLKLGQVDIDERYLFQDPRVVRTKASKAIRTWFFPVGGSAEQIVTDWIRELRENLGWGDADPLFPATEVGLEERRFTPAGVKRANWSNADSIRKIFRRAFLSAGLPYFNPHSVRKTLARLGERVCPRLEHFKAWSQNLGHEHMLTTDYSYCGLPSHRQRELMREVADPRLADPLADIAARLDRLEADRTPSERPQTA